MRLARVAAPVLVTYVVAFMSGCTSMYRVYPDGYESDSCADEEDEDDEDNACSEEESDSACEGGAGEGCEEDPCETELEECLDRAQDAENSVACDLDYRACSGQQTDCATPFDSCTSDDEEEAEGGSDSEICSCMYYLCTGEISSVEHSEPSCAAQFEACLDEEPEDACECEYRACADL
ncbi:MAG: hypothetical protein ACPG4T_11940 [Nannocystaceae bacterium]